MDLRRPGRNFTRRSRLQSFALGSLLGAAGAVATARRLRGLSRAGQAAGLAAFEDAPCFLELAASGAPDGRHEESAGSGEDAPETG